MKIKRPLAPDFIDKLDAHLLLHKPTTWSSRTHLVVYYGLLFIVAITILSFISNADPRDNSGIAVWATIISLLCVIGFIVWMIYLLRFNVFKRFGIQKPGDGIKTFALYFIAIGVMVFCPFVPAITESYVANRAYTSTELVKDVNSINTKICQIEYDSLGKDWDLDTIKLSAKITRTIKADNTIEEVAVLVDSVAAVDNYDKVYYPIGDNFKFLDSTEFYSTINTADSLIKISDSTYKIYTCPNYQLLTTTSDADEHSPDSILTRLDLYKTIIKNYQPVNRKKVLEELELLIKKYYPQYERGKNTYLQNLLPEENQNLSHFARINYRYELTDVGYAINNIAEKKYRWEGLQLYGLIRAWYYTTLVLTLLVFIYRHSTIKIFFLSLLTAALLGVFTAIFLLLGGANALGTCIVALVYVLIFALTSLSLFKDKTRSTPIGISLNLFTFSFVFIPLLLVSTYYAYLHYIHPDVYYYQNAVLHQQLFGREELHYQIAEIAGSFLLFIAIEPLFKKLYRAWYAKPEQ
ncbi:MAG: hypothetical protein RLZZ316_2095 [Bacteroidota bacterium]